MSQNEWRGDLSAKGIVDLSAKRVLERGAQGVGVGAVGCEIVGTDISVLCKAVPIRGSWLW